MRSFLFALVAGSLLFSQGVPQSAPKVDPGLAPYVPTQAITTTVESIGADSLTDVWEEWRAGFKALQPGAQFKVNHGLSTAAVKAFMENASPMIHMARELTLDEHKAFEKKFGYAPTKVVACYDAFIVFVNAGNPIKDIGMDQLDAAYSTTRNGGYKSDSTVETWGDLGVRGSDYARRPIHAYMRAEGTASRTTIQDLVLLKGKYKPTVKDAVDWPSIAEAVMTDASGLGIGTLSNWLSRNKTLAVAPLQVKEPVPPTQENVVSGKYPLSRTYYFYVNRAPGAQLSPAVAEFLSFVLSRQGQNAVALASLFPLPPDIAQLNRKRLRAN
ncbi:MAG: substrate-binding domain-containing protein [Geothrix sp.]|uniref:PstS family phosphate ABC transporter substrate-binding protein n=1 Tax=Geothrix sp. TaxID=1962974 RepID=UPI0017EDBB38|nr:substrate-binding domain-containing protein [Geothrix sp.]NWJ41114.1 substrate-binding domain-containing protein [Geothrix sp.]WIL20894.1 MAG: substrate-binding domain-containing protein [Geothrix sp.]